MECGIIYSSASAVDGIIDRIKDEFGSNLTIVATGGLAKKIIPYCRQNIIIDENLLLKGLEIIYLRNRHEKRY